MLSKTIVLVHGLSASKHSWDLWVARYQSRGYTVVAPAYHPGLDRSLAELKQSSNDPLLSTITLPQVLAHLTKVIMGLDEQPIIMGHSFGGLLTQLLLQRDLGVAGVAVDGAPPMGLIPTQWSFIRYSWPFFNPLIPATKPWYMTFKQFQYAWTHTLPLAEQRAAYEAVIVPESRGLYRSALTRDARVDWARPRPALLIIAGEKDHIFHPALNRANYKRYAKSPSVTDFKEFPGRTHYTAVAGKAWEEVADYALDWAAKVQTVGVTTTAEQAARRPRPPSPKPGSSFSSRSISISRPRSRSASRAISVRPPFNRLLSSCRPIRYRPTYSRRFLPAPRRTCARLPASAGSAGRAL